MRHSPESAETRARLLDAAGEIFAARGFYDATIREICQRADANVAAIHYHYGDKAELYDAVVRCALDCAVQKHPLPPVSGTPEEQLARHIRLLLARLFDEGRPSWHAKIMAREMMEPTQAIESLLEQIRVHRARLGQIIRALLGPNASDEVVRLCASSVSGQCLYYYHCRPVLTRLQPKLRYDEAGIERLTEHITNFSLAAIKGYRHA